MVFVSPPWGGVGYCKDEVYDLASIKPSFEEIVKKCLELADNLVLFLPRNADLSQVANVLLKHDKLFANNGKECIVTIESLIYGGYNIKALLVLIGPMFYPKTQELIPRIKALFEAQFDPYESIIVQNVMRGKTVSACYEKALEIQQEKEKTPKDFIGKLKAMFTEEEWAIVKKLHKKSGGGVKGAITEPQKQAVAGKRALPEEPAEQLEEPEEGEYKENKS